MMDERVLSEILADLDESLNDSWEALVDLRMIEYEMVSRIALIDGNDYDEARTIVQDLSQRFRSEIELEEKLTILKDVLFGEQKRVLKRFLMDECRVSGKRLEEVTGRIHSLDELRVAAESISRHHRGPSSIDYGERIDNWEKKVEALGRRFFYANDIQKKIESDISHKICEHSKIANLRDSIGSRDLLELVMFVFLRTGNAPRLKDVTKPTIVLVGGTSGTGKSTISQHITTSLNFPVYSSTDVVSREVVRRITAWMMGRENARSTFPELFGSSFEGSDLSWYYMHSMMTMIGVVGAIDNLIQGGTSAVIEGVPLVPGTLPDRFFEEANIVWMVACIDDEDEHFKRYSGRDRAGVDRGGSERYRKRFGSIRRIHDRLSHLTSSGGALRLENSGELGETLSFALDRVRDPFSDKGLRVTDELRDGSFFELSTRRYLMEFDRSLEEPKKEFLRSHSHPEVGGPTVADIEEALSLWRSHNEDRIIELKKSPAPRSSDEEDVEDTVVSELHRLEVDMGVARDVMEPARVQELLRSNFELLRATRSLLIQLRSLQVDLLARLTQIPGTNYDEARTRVHRFFKEEARGQDIEITKNAIKKLMFDELLHIIGAFLESEYNIESQYVIPKLHVTGGLEDLRSSLDRISESLFLNRIDRDLSTVQMTNIINIWEEKLDASIERNFEIFRSWRALERSERELLHNHDAMEGVRDRITKDELHRLVRWITPRLYHVPKVKDLERRPALILLNGSAGNGGSSVLNRVSTLLSIPTCFTSDMIGKVVAVTLEWLLGKREFQESFPFMNKDLEGEETLDLFYRRSILTMIGMKGALDRLIKENTSAVIMGNAVVPSMMEERYFESSNVIGIVMDTGNGGTSQRMIYSRLKDMAADGNMLIIEDPGSLDSMELVRARVTSPYADRGLPVPDEMKLEGASILKRIRENSVDRWNGRSKAAILTDIDDTLLPSGIKPNDEWMARFSSILGALNDRNIIWAPMSGVAHSKLGERLLFRLPRNVRTNILAYLGDGSSKYRFDDVRETWVKDPGFDRGFTDAQSVAIIGSVRYERHLMECPDPSSDSASMEERIREAVSLLERHNDDIGKDILPIDPRRGLVGELEDRLNLSGLSGDLELKGHEIRDPETYFRGGSVSWMMLGDISAEPYEEKASYSLRRSDLIPYIRRRLKEHDGLTDLGNAGVDIPFPGARGIKFVLHGNDKERGARDLMEKFEIPGENVLFIGNEIFEGGNDDMLRNITGINLVSVGVKQGTGVIDGGMGVDANWKIIERMKEEIDRGSSFDKVVERIRSEPR
ncbi:MAG: hypothetical protein ACMUHY_08505 [Thermoplasmatota archaeon]